MVGINPNVVSSGAHTARRAHHAFRDVKLRDPSLPNSRLSAKGPTRVEIEDGNQFLDGKPIKKANSNPPAKAVDVGPSVADRLIDGSSKAMNVALFAPMAVPVVGGAAGVVGGIAEKTGIDMLAKGARGAQKGIKAFTSKTFGEVFGKIPGAGLVASASEKLAAAVGNVMGFGARVTGIGGFFSRWNEKSSVKHFGKLGEAVKSAQAEHTALPQELRAHASELISAASASGQQHLNIEAVRAAERKLAEAADKVRLDKPAKAAMKSLSNVNKLAEKTAASHAGISEWKNVGAAVKGVPSAIGKSEVLHGLGNAAQIGFVGYQMVDEGRGFAHNLAALKQVIADIKNVPVAQVSTYDALMGDSNPLVKEQRGRILKNITASGVADVASLAVALKGALNRHVPMIAFFAPQLAEMGAKALIGESFVGHYDMLRKAHAQGQKLPAEEIAKFIGVASPELKKHGGEAGAFTQKIAQDFAEANTSPADMLREITDGKIAKRISAIIAANEALKSKAAEAIEPKRSHVEALKNPSSRPVVAKKEHEVVGAHTAQVNANAQNAELART